MLLCFRSTSIFDQLNNCDLSSCYKTILSNFHCFSWEQNCCQGCQAITGNLWWKLEVHWWKVLGFARILWSNYRILANSRACMMSFQIFSGSDSSLLIQWQHTPGLAGNLTAMELLHIAKVGDRILTTLLVETKVKSNEIFKKWIFPVF